MCARKTARAALRRRPVLRRTFPDVKVIIMTGLPDLSFIDEAKEAGVFSFVYKSLNARDLVAVLRQAQKNLQHLADKAHDADSWL